jgi:hypothetical protein
MNKWVFVLSAGVCLASAFASAKENYHEVVKADSADSFSQVSSLVRKDMEPGGRYEFVKPDERSTIDKKFEAMASLFQEKGSVDKMTQSEKVALFNSQEAINAILTKRDSDRVICQNVLPIGSHIPKTSCHTYGQEEEGKRGTDHIMQAWQNGPCMRRSQSDSGCGGNPHDIGAGH